MRLNSTKFGTICLLLSAVDANLTLAQYQDTSSESARGFWNNRIQANISDQGSGYSPSPYGPYGPYYSRPLTSNQNAQRNRSRQGQIDGLPDFGISLPSDEYSRDWYRERQRKIDLGVNWSEDGERLLATEVDDDGELAHLGLRVGDELVSFDDHPVHSLAEWRQAIESVKPGQEVPLVVRRDGHLETLRWPVGPPELEELPVGADNTRPVGFITAARFHNGPQGRARLGVELEPDDERRAVVRSVDKNSAAEEAGLHSGDVIVSLSGRNVASAAELVRLVSQSRAGSVVELYIERPRTTPTSASDEIPPQID